MLHLYKDIYGEGLDWKDYKHFPQLIHAQV